MLSKGVDVQARDQAENLAKKPTSGTLGVFHPNSCAWVLRSSR